MLRILIVDDSATQAEQLNLLLQASGYGTELAYSGQEALNKLRADKEFDAVIADVIMPGMSGYDLCRTIRSTDGLADLPVILLTATKDREDFLHSFQSGADAFLTKPYDHAILLSRLATTIRGTGQLILETDPDYGVGEQREADRLVKMLVNGIQDVSDINTKLETSRLELDGARRAITAKADKLSAQLSSIQTDLRLRNEVIEASESMVAVLREDESGLQILDVNGAAANITGYEPGALTGLSLEFLLDSSIRELASAEIRRELGKSRTLNKPIKLRHRTGTPTYCQLSIIDIDDEPVVGQRNYLCIIKDINRSYRTRKAMLSLTEDLVGLQGAEYYEQAALKLSQILDLNVVSITQVRINADGSRNYISKGMASNSQIERGAAFDPEGVLYQTLLLQKKLLVEKGLQERFPDNPALKDRNLHSMFAQQLSDPAGSLVGHIAVLDTRPIQDVSLISDVVRIFGLAIGNAITNELSQQRYFELFQFAPDPMLMISMEGEVKMCNDQFCRLLGFEQNEIESIKIEEILPDVSTLLEGYRLSNGNGAKIFPENAVEMVGHKRGGGELPLEVSINFLVTTRGPKIIVACRDLSERKLYEADHLARLEAERASEEKTAFLAAMSHEIRTPINGVIGCADLLARQSLKAQQVDLVETIQESSRNLLQVIDDILDFSKIEAGKLSLTEEPVSLQRLTEGACRALRHYAYTSNVRLMLFTDPSLPPLINSDGVRITQLINNLVSNAIKFSKRKERRGNVHVRAFPASGDSIMVTVSDDGIGIREEAKAKLFTPFTQAESNTSRKYGGSGLGLSICKTLIEMMGGEIGFDSEEGKGSTFYFKLPAVTYETTEVEAKKTSLDGAHCVLSSDRQQYREDWSAYLTAAGATIEMIQDFATLQQHAQNNVGKEVVYILDFDKYEIGYEVLANLQASNARIFTIDSGRRRQARLIKENFVSLDRDAMTRDEFIHGVAIALGREEDFHVGREDRVGNDIFLPPDREQAIRERELILVAEDNEVNQKVIRRQLAALGFAADVVSNGREALYAWQKGIYSLILSDIHMPEMDGYELAGEIRRQESGKGRIPVVALTANALRGEEEVCLRAGMDDYLSKPVNLDKLEDTVRKWLKTLPHSREGIIKNERISDDGDDLSILDLDVLRELIGDDEYTVLQLVEEYKDSITAGGAELISGIGALEFRKAADTAHRLKSSAKTMGSFKFASLCQEIEDSVKSRGEINTDQITIRIRSYIEEILAELDK